jgi:translation initiation factor 1 (eIF-1/SUI1)
MEQAKQFMKPVGERMPNYFYYAVPDGMLEADEVPPYAGLIYIHEDKGFSIIREAPRLHTTKYTDGELNLGEKFYYNMKTWQKNYREQVEYSLMYRERLQHELDSKNQDKSYKELQDELEKAKGNIRCLQEDSQKYYGLYMTMVEGADYNTIERRLLLNELKAHGVDVEKRYSEIMEEAENLYQQRYPSHHREKQEQQ